MNIDIKRIWFINDVTIGPTIHTCIPKRMTTDEMAQHKVTRTPDGDFTVYEFRTNTEVRVPVQNVACWEEGPKSPLKKPKVE